MAPCSPRSTCYIVNKGNILSVFRVTFRLGFPFASLVLLYVAYYINKKVSSAWTAQRAFGRSQPSYRGVEHTPGPGLGQIKGRDTVGGQSGVPLPAPRCPWVNRRLQRCKWSSSADLPRVMAGALSCRPHLVPVSPGATPKLEAHRKGDSEGRSSR